MLLQKNEHPPLFKYQAVAQVVIHARSLEGGRGFESQAPSFCFIFSFILDIETAPFHLFFLFYHLNLKEK